MVDGDIKKLQLAVEYANDDRQKVDLLNELALKFNRVDPNQALATAETALHLAKSIAYPVGYARSLAHLTGAYGRLAQYEKALALGDQALQLFETLDDAEGHGQLLMNIAWVCRALGDYAGALEHLMTCLHIYQRAGNVQGEIRALNGIGVMNWHLGDQENARKYYQDVIDLSREYQLKETEGIALMNMGVLYCDGLGEYEKSIEYYEASDRIFIEVGNLRARNDVQLNLGVAFGNLGNYERSVEHYQRCLKAVRKLGDRSGEAHVLENIGALYNQQERYEDALTYLQQALQIYEETAEKPRWATAHRALSEVYEAMGDLGHALEHYKRFYELDREVVNDNSERKFQNLQVVYQVEQSRKEAELLRVKNAELEELNRELEDQNVKLVEAQTQLIQAQADRIEKEKLATLGKLSAMISHKLNNILSGLTAPIEHIMRFEPLNEALIWEAWESDDEGHYLDAYLKHYRAEYNLQRRAAEIVQEAATRAKLLVHDLQGLVGEQSGKLGRLNLVEVFREVYRIHQDELDHAHIVEHFDTDTLEVTAKRGEVGQIFIGLLMNAVDAVQNCSEPTIDVFMRPLNDGVEIQVVDNGCGMPDSVKAHLFEPFFTTKTETGSGLGLYTIQRIVMAYQGTITVESQPGHGTTVTVWFPQGDQSIPLFTT